MPTQERRFLKMDSAVDPLEYAFHLGGATSEPVIGFDSVWSVAFNFKPRKDLSDEELRSLLEVGYAHCAKLTMGYTLLKSQCNSLGSRIKELGGDVASVEPEKEVKVDSAVYSLFGWEPSAKEKESDLSFELDLVYGQLADLISRYLALKFERDWDIARLEGLEARLEKGLKA